MKIKTLYKYRRYVRLLLDPAEGETANAGGGSASAVADPTVATIVQTANEAVMPEPDWSKGEGSNVEDFLNLGNKKEEPATENKPVTVNSKGNEEEQAKVDKEAEEAIKAEGKGEAEGEEAKQEQQTDDKGEGHRQENADGKDKNQQQVEENPIHKRFPETKLFAKKMSKEAWTYVQGVLGDFLEKEAELQDTQKTLAMAQKGIAKIPDSYYDNPSAIVLLPEFQQASFGVNLAKQIADHWDKQYELILGGEEWYDLDDVTDAQGNVVGVKVNPTPQTPNAVAQHRIGKYLRRAETQLDTLTNHQNKLASDFQSMVSQRIGKIKEAEKELFKNPNWDKQGTPEYKLMEYVAKGVKNLGITEHNPAFTLLAKTGAAYLQLLDYVQSQQKKEDKSAKLEEKSRKAGPTGHVTGASGGSNEATGNGEDVMAAFNKVLINKH